MTGFDEAGIPLVFIARSHKALADAIDVMEIVQNLLRETDDLLATSGVLCGGPNGGEDPDCELELMWSDNITGHMEVQSVLIAIADQIGKHTGSEGSWLQDERAYTLRKRFGAFL